MADAAAGKRKKQQRKMTKLLSKAWSLDRADPFQEVAATESTGTATPLDLTTMGQNLDGGMYSNGKAGWELFASHLGGVYNRFITIGASSNGKHSKLAKEHLEEVGSYLSKIEPHLAEIAKKSIPSAAASPSAASSLPSQKRNVEALHVPKKKRKHANANNVDISTAHIPKKKHAAGNGNLNTITTNSNSNTRTSSLKEDNLTLSQREERAMQSLGTYLEECGGSKDQVNSFRCKITQTGERFVTLFFSLQGRRLRSMVEVARFLNLKPPTDASSSTHNSNNNHSTNHHNHNQYSVVIKQGYQKPRNNRELEAERKKLRRELDKLLKLHGKSTKALDDFRNERRDDLFPMDDNLLLANKGNTCQSQSSHHSIRKVIFKPDMDSFPGLPAHSTPDLLLVWDFLCTFHRAISLEPIGLDDFAAALTYSPKRSQKHAQTHLQQQQTLQQQTDDSYSSFSSLPSSPLFLAEAHLALIRLLLADTSSEEWWWSTLETVETEGQDGGTTNTNTTYETHTTTAAAKGEADHVPATIRIDIAALLNDTNENPSVTKRWLQALEDVRTRRANAGGPIKSAVKSAISITVNPFVKMYLKKAMRKWKGSSAGFTKQSVVWLIGRVREARPDLWGRKVGKEALEEYKARVIREASLAMEHLDEIGEEEEEDMDNETMQDIHSGGESEEESESDEDENYEDPDDEFGQNGQGQGQEQEQGTNKTNSRRKSKIQLQHDNHNSNNNHDDDEMKPITSSIPIKPPPTLVDLLLPPRKPLPNTDIVSPFTWPALAGAAACRILHRYKRLRNEVDDSLREFREMRPLSVAQRRLREKRAPFRIFSECASIIPNDNEEEDEDSNPIESAIDHLCRGNNYLDLTPLQKLCILRVLVEACYDSHKIYQSVQENIKSRIGAVKQLENEERRAKKDAREEAAAVELAARERLVKLTKESFLMKKKREIMRNNKYTKEFSDDYINSLTDEEIAEIDEETKAEYDALPGTQNFNKTEVNLMVTKINEENAFGTTALEVLTLEEIQSREANELHSMEEELQSYGTAATEYQLADRETSAKVDKLKKEIANFKEWLVSLPQARTEAIDALKDAIEDGTIKALRSAIRMSKLALLTGDDDETGGIWALDLLRDASLELKAAERRKKVIEAQKDLVAKRDKCFVRTEPIGSDRFYDTYWQFDYDGNGRIWCEADYQIKDSRGNENSENDIVDGDLSIDVHSASIGAPDEEDDIIESEDCEKESFLQFSRQEYHSSGRLSALTKRHYGCHSTDYSLRGLVKNLDGRGVREGALREALKEILESNGLASSSDSTRANSTTEKGSPDEQVTSVVNPQSGTKQKEGASFKTTGDEALFSQAKSHAELNKESFDEDIDLDLLSNINSAIGKRVRLRIVADPVTAPLAAEYVTCTVTGWSLEEQDKQTGIDTDDSLVPEEEKNGIALWRLAVDKGGEKVVRSLELLAGLTREIKWKFQHEGYIENDSTLFSYRNKLGRFCGRAADAPQASSPLYLSRLILKREQEFYMPLKSRTYDNNWGGKNGARNAWIASMKEYGHDFNTVRNGLLTLEGTFYEFCGGSFSDNFDQANMDIEPVVRSGRELLEDDEYRFEIELESIGQTVKSLWNSQDTRSIFREIISSCSTIDIIALGLDLLCRNCQAYLDATKPSITRNSYEQGLLSTTGRVTRSSYDQPASQSTGSRRMNSWQQQHQYF